MRRFIRKWPSWKQLQALSFSSSSLAPTSHSSRSPNRSTNPNHFIAQSSMQTHHTLLPWFWRPLHPREWILLQPWLKLIVFSLRARTAQTNAITTQVHGKHLKTALCKNEEWFWKHCKKAKAYILATKGGRGPSPFKQAWYPISVLDFHWSRLRTSPPITTHNKQLIVTLSKQVIDIPEYKKLSEPQNDGKQEEIQSHWVQLEMEVLKAHASPGNSQIDVPQFLCPGIDLHSQFYS